MAKEGAGHRVTGKDSTGTLQGFVVLILNLHRPLRAHTMWTKTDLGWRSSHMEGHPSLAPGGEDGDSESGGLGIVIRYPGEQEKNGKCIYKL